MGATMVDGEEKAQLLFDHFDEIMGMQQERSVCLHLTGLNLPTLQLSSLDRWFLEEEIWHVIRSLPPDKVLVPDGFMCKTPYYRKLN
jgi:hypothetical protein